VFKNLVRPGGHFDFILLTLRIQAIPACAAKNTDRQLR
jgi:hypothetical protein